MNFNNNFAIQISTEKLINPAIQLNDIFREEDSDFVKFNLFEGNSFLEAGKYANAIERFDVVIAVSPYDYYARLARGLTYILTDQLVHALTDFDLILEFNNADPRALYYRGYVYLLAGCYEEALNDFNSIHPSEDDDTAYYVNLYRCVCYYNLKSFGTALSCINVFINEKEDKPELHLLRGFIYLELSQYEKCIADMDHVLLFDDENEDALYTKFIAHSIMGLNKEANLDIKFLLDNKLYYLSDLVINDIIEEFQPSLENRFMLN